MKNYELVFVVRPNAEDEVKEAILNKVQEVIAQLMVKLIKLILGKQKISLPNS